MSSSVLSCKELRYNTEDRCESDKIDQCAATTILLREKRDHLCFVDFFSVSCGCAVTSMTDSPPLCFVGGVMSGGVGADVIVDKGLL